MKKGQKRVFVALTELYFIYLFGYPNRVKGSEGYVADLEVENAWENKQQAAGCCGSWKRNRKVTWLSQTLQVILNCLSGH